MAKKTTATTEEVKVESGEVYEASAVALVGRSELNITIIEPNQIEKYLLSHPVVPFGIDKKANRIINRSYNVVGGSDTLNAYCKSILENSGGDIFIKNWIKDAYGFGTSFAELAYSADKTQVIKCVIKHPVYFGYLKSGGSSSGFGGDSKQAIVFDENTGKPKGFCPYIYKDGKRTPVVEKAIPYEKVAALKFDTWGDEIEGISIVQYIHETIRQLLNIEIAGAEQLYRNGFTQKKFKTNIRSVEKLKQFSKSIANLNESDAIVLLDGTDVENLQPGNSDFVPFHKEFMNLLSIALGIPTALLTMDGANVNKASLGEMRSEMYQDSFADELIIKRTIDESIFYTACKLIEPTVRPEDVPKFMFKRRRIEIGEEIELKKIWSDLVDNLTKSAKVLYDSGRKDVADKLVDSIGEFNFENPQPIQGLFEEGQTKKNHGES